MDRRAEQQADGQAVRTVKILQLTDAHCYADPGKTLLGLNTEQSFQAVLRLAQRRHGPADLILATGDLVHDGSAQGYQRLKHYFADTGVPVYPLPGNHDDRDRLVHVLNGGNLRPERSARYGDWQIIL
ncbi:MAG: metallophosphoesterase, partial [Gammaproteobacteria bacterium]|nr:metallophosphoesterase [Gammaproteobacteria bacterium]